MFEKSNLGFELLVASMFNQGLYFQTLDLTRTKVLLNLRAKSFVIQSIEVNQNTKPFCNFFIHCQT